MTVSTLPVLQKRIALVHDWLLQAGSTITPGQFTHVFSSQAPPIGWHLWHITRFTDRLQAHLAAVTDGAAGNQFWRQEFRATEWASAPEHLGVHETGAGQPHADAVLIVTKAGQSAIIHYAQTVFTRCDTILGKLSADQLECAYYGILDFDTDVSTGRIWETDPRESLVVQDLAFHLNHASRHLGAMEALRGLFDSTGSITV